MAELQTSRSKGHPLGLFVRLGVLIVLSSLSTAGIGCSDGSLGLKEVKRIDEKVTESELQTFLRIIDALPKKKLPDFPIAYAPPPQWSSARTLQVGELVAEEINLIEERWNKETLAKHLNRNKRLQRGLRRERMTSEQFVGLALAIGMAISRGTVRDNQDLEQIVKESNPAIEQLSRDNRRFSSLNPEEMHSVLKRAVWMTRQNRAKRLLLVPPENVALVVAHREQLEALFPREYTSNPLDPVADQLKDLGLPFEELKSSGLDAEIEWDSAGAIAGKDAPDPVRKLRP